MQLLKHGLQWLQRHAQAGGDGALAGYDRGGIGFSGGGVFAGGDQQIGAMIAEGGIDGLIFLVDPLSPHPHDVDVKALTRLALVYDIPMALNEATAELILSNKEIG